MRKTQWLAAAMVMSAVVSTQARAGTYNTTFSFFGRGVSGLINLTYTENTSPPTAYPGHTDPASAYKVTGISGTVTDTNNSLNLIDEQISGLVQITSDSAPEPTNLLAPASFSKFKVAMGLPQEDHGTLTYDNLYYPIGSPQTASDYPVHGGFLDIYGLGFTLQNGDFVDFWSNGGDGPLQGDYGVALATAAQGLDYVGGGVHTPEPATFALLGAGLAGLGISRRRRAG